MQNSTPIDDYRKKKGNSLQPAWETGNFLKLIKIILKKKKQNSTANIMAVKN